jgi:hypothetical protein
VGDDPCSPADITTVFAALHESGYVQVFGRRQRQSNCALRRPASEKRQGTKSRGGVVRRRRRGRYGDLAARSDARVMKRGSGETDFGS